MVLSEKNAREKDLVEWFKCLQKQIQVADTKYKRGCREKCREKKIKIKI
jgi:hypothetical protein